jgi:hypothetical protein
MYEVEVEHLIRMIVPKSSRGSRLMLSVVVFTKLLLWETRHHIKIDKMAASMQHEKR